MSDQTQPIWLQSPDLKKATIPTSKQYFERTSDSCDNEFKHQFNSLKHADCQTNILSLQKKEEQEQQYDYQILSQSQFEFSEQIMVKNKSKQARILKQQTRLPILQIFDWIMQTTAALKLSKQAFYRSIIIFRKFLLFEKKQKQSRVTKSNGRLFGFASLLLANKIQNIDGNFLNGKKTLVDGVAKINKKLVIQCQLYILKILNYSIPLKSLITEALIKIINQWNSITLQLNLSLLSFDLTNANNQNQIFQHQLFLRKYLYLVDNVMMRNFTTMNLENFHEIQQPKYYQLHLTNILFNLCSETLTLINKRHYNFTFYKGFQILVKLLNPPSTQIHFYSRRSQFLLKKVHHIDFKFRKLYQKHYEKTKFKNQSQQQLTFISNLKIQSKNLLESNNKEKQTTEIEKPNQTLNTNGNKTQNFCQSNKIIKITESNPNKQLPNQKSGTQMGGNIITSYLQRLINPYDLKQFQVRHFVDTQRYFSLFHQNYYTRKTIVSKYKQ